MGFTFCAALGFEPQRSRPRQCRCFFQESLGPGGLRGEVGKGASWGEQGHSRQVRQETDSTGQQGASRRREGSLDSGNPNGVPRARRSRGPRREAGRAGSGQPRCPRSWLLPATPLQDLLRLPEHGLHKHPQRLDVDPGDKGFAEVHLEPAQQGALRGQESCDPSGLLHPTPLQERTQGWQSTP